MATEVILPRVDMDMAEGKIAFWHVKNGDVVTKGQVLFDIETDKATMEVDAPAGGVIAGLRGEIGVSMPVGEVVGWILAPGESLPAGMAAPAADAAPGHTSPDLPAAAPAEHAQARPGSSDPAAAVLRATPLARSLARSQGLPLSSLRGSGPAGRVLGRDVIPAAQAAQRASPLSSLHLHWWQRGAGAPLVLLHGFGADHGSWRPLVQQLPRQWPVLAVDLPNHGKSAAQAAGSLDALAQSVAARLDEEGLDGWHLLGHSLGGGVALALSRLQPDRLKSLTLLAPVGLGADINAAFVSGLVQAHDETALKAALAHLFHDPATLTGSFVATAFQQLASPSRRDALGAMARHLMPDGVQQDDLRPVLDGVTVPVKVIWGLSDRILSAMQAQGLPGRVALHLLPRVGHLPQIEACALVADLVTQQFKAAA